MEFLNVANVRSIFFEVVPKSITAMILWELFVFPGGFFCLYDMKRPNQTLCFWLKWNAAQGEAKISRFMNMIDFYLLKAVVKFCNEIKTAASFPDISLMCHSWL